MIYALFLFILLTPESDHYSSYRLLQNLSWSECVVERERITSDMQKSYPGDVDYFLECR